VVDRDAVVEISKELESSMCWRKKQFLRKKQRKEAGDAREVIEVFTLTDDVPSRRTV
jgi:hypothetical protein